MESTTTYISIHFAIDIFHLLCCILPFKRPISTREQVIESTGSSWIRKTTVTDHFIYLWIKTWRLWNGVISICNIHMQYPHTTFYHCVSAFARWPRCVSIFLYIGFVWCEMYGVIWIQVKWWNFCVSGLTFGFVYCREYVMLMGFKTIWSFLGQFRRSGYLIFSFFIYISRYFIESSCLLCFNWLRGVIFQGAVVWRPFEFISWYFGINPSRVDVLKPGTNGVSIGRFLSYIGI